MIAWWEPYLNKPWSAEPVPPHSFTCGELVRAVHRDRLGLGTAAILIDPERLLDCLTELGRPEHYGFRRLGSDESPRDFDCVFMARSGHDDHVGVAAQTGEGLMILHCLKGAGVVLNTPAELRGQRFTRFTWYRHREAS